MASPLLLARLQYIACFAALGLCACHGRPSRTAPPLAGPGAPPHSQAGAAVLASVENARFAIRRGDKLAAVNDVLQASRAAAALADHNSALFPLEPTAPHAGSGSAGQALTAFEVRVRLADAAPQLRLGQLARADQDLAAIEAGAPGALVPADLPLLRARQSLRLATEAGEASVQSQVRTQLATARASLQWAADGPRQAEARRLAGDIGSTLAAPQTPDPAQLQAWSAQVEGWT